MGVSHATLEAASLLSDIVKGDGEIKGLFADLEGDRKVWADIKAATGGC